MAIRSMTGIGRKESIIDGYSVVIEIKSVNHRFKDLKFKIPSLFSFITPNLKKVVDQFFRRGFFEIYISFKRDKSENKTSNLDKERVMKFIEDFAEIKKEISCTLAINPVDFLRAEFLNDTLENLKNYEDHIIDTLKLAAKELQLAREDEGLKLKAVIVLNIKSLIDSLIVIEQHIQDNELEIKEKFNKKLGTHSLLDQVDNARFNQEIVYYLEKRDISEEIDRIKSHSQKLSDLMELDREVGREIDFILQELNREINTLGSKASKIEVSDAVIQMKVHLEKIREQALNIE